MLGLQARVVTPVVAPEMQHPAADAKKVIANARDQKEFFRSLLQSSTREKPAELGDIDELFTQIKMLDDADLKEEVLLDAKNPETFLGRHCAKHHDKLDALLTAEAKVFFDHGVALGDTFDAISSYFRVIRLKPSVEAYYRRGSCYALGRYAIEDFSVVIKLDPNHVGAYVARGRCYSADMSKLDDAINDLNNAIRLNPKCVEAYHARGNCYVKMGLYSKAINDFNEAINLGCKDSEFKKYKAILMSLYAFEISDLLCEPIRQKFFDKVEKVICIDLLLQKISELKDADAELRQAILIEAQKKETYFGRHCDEHFKKNAKELVLLERLSAYEARACISLAIACFHENDFDSAIRNYNYAIQLKYKPDAAFYNNLGYFYYKISEFNKAIENYIKAIELQPDYERARGSLKQVLSERLAQPSKEFIDFLLRLGRNKAFTDVVEELNIDDMLKKIKALGDEKQWHQLLIESQKQETFFGQIFKKHPAKLAELLDAQVGIYLDRIKACCLKHDFQGAVQNCNLAVELKFKNDRAIREALDNLNIRAASNSSSAVAYQALGVNLALVDYKSESTNDKVKSDGDGAQPAAAAAMRVHPLPSQALRCR